MVSTEFLKASPIFMNITDPSGAIVQCYYAKMVNDTGIWRETNPLSLGLPTFLTQLVLITSVNHLFLFILKPFNQPPIIAEILAGLLFGPSIMGRLKGPIPLLKEFFAPPRLMTLETLGNLGLNYTLFILGLEIDVPMIPRIGKKAMTVALSGALFPMIVGVFLYYLMLHATKQPFQILSSFYWGVTLSVTGLPVVAIILARLKLLHTDIGKTAMASALVNEIVSWVLFIIILAFSNDSTIGYYSITCTIVFVLVCIFVVRPIILWFIERRQNGEDFNESTVCLLLAAVLVCGLATDLVGTTSMIGVFVFGLIIPNGLLAHKFLEVLQGFTSDFLMPIFFVVSGFRSDLDAFANMQTVWLVLVVVCLACISKVVSTIALSFFFDMPVREGLALGVLMNTKGLLAIIAINAAIDRKIIKDQEFTVLLVSILVMTIGTVPIMRFLHKSSRRLLPSKHRAMQRLKPEAELRILACIHETHTVSGITNLLKASNPSKRSPICVFALQLIQLTGHGTTALLIVHGPPKSNSQNSRIGAQSQTDQIITAFENLELDCDGGSLTIQPLTAMSSYNTMHEDICSIAEDKRVTLVILPFHKRQTIHNRMEDTNPAYREVNDNVLANPPCSVGILVDRGIGTRWEEDHDHVHGHDSVVLLRRIAVLFFGGFDDREALCYAFRMAGHPNTALTVIRFIPGQQKNTMEVDENSTNDFDINGSEKRGADESYINQFLYNCEGDNSIQFLEKVVNNGAETVATIRSTGADNYDLYVVGRGMGRAQSPLTAGLGEWSECPELGPIGDLLVTSDFSSNVSVLVVQQYAGQRHGGGDVLGTQQAGLLSQNERVVRKGNNSDSSVSPFVGHRDTDEGY